MDEFFALPYVRYSIISLAALLVALVISKILRIIIDRFIKLSSKKLRVDHTSGFMLKTDLNKSIKEQFDKQGIEIPFPYRSIVYKNK